MGLLKHVLLPLFSLLDLALVHKCLIAEDFDDFFDAWRRDVEAFPMTPFETHFAHCVGAAFLAFFINNLAAIFFGNAHHRGIALALHGIYFSVDLHDYITLKAKLVPPIIYVILVTVVLGLAVHAKEPGVFTSDKEATKSKKG